MISNQCAAVRFRLSAVVSCECKLILLRETASRVVFSLVRTAHKFDSKLLVD